MKKILLMASVAILATLASCSGTKSAEDKGADLKAKIESCSDPDSLKVYVQQAQEYAAKLLKEGKGAEAEAYLEEVKPAVAAKDPSLLSVLTAQADSAATEVAEKAAAAAADSVKAKAAEVKDSIASKGAKAVDAAKDAAKDAADKAASAAKDAAKDAAGKAASAASDAAGKAADKIKGAIGQ